MERMMSQCVWMLVQIFGKNNSLITLARGSVADPLPNSMLGKGSGIMQYIELSPQAHLLIGVGMLHSYDFAAGC